MDKYLPIGTVVLLEGGNKRLMITGYKAIDNETSKVYDYVGCAFPEGILATDENFLFNHDSIYQIHLSGMENDEEFLAFQNRLRKIDEEDEEKDD